MANTIRLKQGTGSDPSASDLVLGEPAVRTDTGEIFLLKDNGSIAKVAGGIDDGDKGDITVSNSGATFTIDSGAVTYAKMGGISQNRLMGRISSGSGSPETLTPANVRTIINVEDGATADQTASEILTLIKTVDGSGSGLDADLLDGVSSASFLRSDTADSMSAKLTLNQDNDNEKLVLAGTDDPFIRWQEGTTNKAYIEWNSSGYLRLKNQEDDATLRIKDDLDFSQDGSTFHSIYHEGNLTVGDGGLTQNNFTNSDHSKLDGIESGATTDQSASEILTLIKTVDGSGSGLDADTVDGLEVSASGGVSKILCSKSDGDVDIGSTSNIYVQQILATSQTPAIFTRAVTGTSPVAIQIGNNSRTWAISAHSTEFSIRDHTNVNVARLTIDTSGVISGNGSGLTGVNATTLDSIDSGSFLRSDAADTMSGQLSLTYSSTYPLLINGSDDGKIELSGSSSPYIRFEEGTTDKAYIRWDSGGFFGIYNQEDSSSLRVKDDLDFSQDGSTYHSIYHEGNLSVGDGGLTQNNFTNADHSKLDGIAANANNYSFPYTVSASASNSTVVQRHSSGYIFANYFNTTPDDVSSGVTKVCVETGNDGYIRHGTASAIRSFINVADGATNVTNNNQLTNGAGYTTYTANQALDTTSDVTFDDIYANNWFRNNVSGEGLYNQATGQHWYSDHDDYWNIGGGGSSNGIRFRDENAGTIRGYVYANSSNQVGFLDSDGNWAVRVDRDVDVGFRVNGTLEATVLPDTFKIEGCFFENAQAVAADKTISNGYNAMSAGPITINSGVTVTIGSGEAWTIV